MKSTRIEFSKGRYIAPAAEVRSLETANLIAASGMFNANPWNNGQGNNEWCS